MDIMQAVVDTFKTKHGTEIRVRKLQSDDDPYLLDLFDHMSSESRYLRFHQSADHPSPAQVEQALHLLTELDPSKDAAYIAFADLPDQPNAPVAVVRYMGTEPGTAEVAFAVRDDMQRQGIGTHLAKFLVEAGRAAGLKKFTATMLASNVGMATVFDRLPYPTVQTVAGDTIEVTIDLTHLIAEPE